MFESEISLGYRPTPERVVLEALKLGQVTSRDTLFDLGSGDGRLLVTAAKKYGVRGIGYEIDRDLVNHSKELAASEGVAESVHFCVDNLFTADLRPASVVFLALMPEAHLELRPKLISSLATGSRVITFKYDMGDWEPDQKTEIYGDPIFLWSITGATKATSRLTDVALHPSHRVRKIGDRDLYFYHRDPSCS